MMKKKMFIWSILLSAFAAGAFARPIQLSRVQAQVDLDMLYGFISGVHPDMFAVYPKERFIPEFQAFYKNLPDSITGSEFYKKASSLIAKLGDGHTHCGISRYAYLDASPQLIPMVVRIDSGDTTMYVRKGGVAGGDTIPAGAQVLSINGRDAKELLTEMMQYTSGERPFFRLDNVESQFQLYLLLVDPAACYTVRYRSADGEHSVQLASVAPAAYSAFAHSVTRQYKEPYTFGVLPGNIGLLSYNSCKDPDRFKRFCDSTFRVVRDRRIEHLIIDVRGNGGGNSDLSDTLFQYISPVPYQQYDRELVRVSAVSRHQYGDMYGSVDTIYTRYLGEQLIPLHENPLRYRGKCYQMISHRTFSSASDFAWAFQYFKMGRTIGEETGGQVVCFGDILTTQLPNSKFGLTTSFKKFHNYGTTDVDLHGVLPDDEVPARDALDYTLKLIRERREVAGL